MPIVGKCEGRKIVMTLSSSCKDEQDCKRQLQESIAKITRAQAGDYAALFGPNASMAMMFVEDVRLVDASIDNNNAKVTVEVTFANSNLIKGFMEMLCSWYECINAGGSPEECACKQIDECAECMSSGRSAQECLDEVRRMIR